MPEPASTPPSAQKPDAAYANRDWRRLHIWEIQPIRDLLVIAALFGVVYLGYQVRIVTIPLLLAMLLAYLFEPVVRWLTRKTPISRSFAAVGIIATFAVVIVLPITIGGGFAVVQGARAATTLATNVAKVQKSIAKPTDADLAAAVPAGAWRKIRDFLTEDSPAGASAKDDGSVLTPELEATHPASARVDEFRVLARRVVDWAGEHTDEIARWAGGKAGSVGGAVGGAVGAAVGTLTSLGMLAFAGFLTAFFFYFFCTGWGKLLQFWEGLIPERKRGKVVDVVSQMDKVIAGFVRGRVTICFILAIFMTIAYGFAGVPAFLILGPIVGMLFIAPYVHVIGVPIAMLLLWLNVPADAIDATSFRHQWWWIVFAPVGVYVLAQLLDDWVLSPMIQGKTTDLPIPTILFASLAGGALAGIYGLLIAIPIAACIKILLREFFWPRFREWAEGKRADFLPIDRE